MIHDPFGSDILDFPVTAYLASVVDNCSAVSSARCLEKAAPVLPHAGRHTPPTWYR